MYTYIIVDDESLTRKGTIKKISEGKIGSLVSCIGQASNGLEAIELIRTCSPDIVITDMQMPIMDGLDFLKELTDKYSCIQVIVISGHRDFEYARGAMNARAVEYILKPFSREEIQNAMQHAVDAIRQNMDAENKVTTIEAEKEYIQFDSDVQLIRSILLGHIEKNHPPLGTNRLASIFKTHDYFLLTLHTIGSIDNDKNKSYIQQALGNLGLYFPHLHFSNIGFVLFFFPQNSPLQMESTCRKLARDIIDFLKTPANPVSIGISSLKNELDSLPKAYNETITALNNAPLKERNQFYFYKDEDISSSALVWDSMNEFLFRIEAGETQAVQSLLDQLYLIMDEYSKYKTGNMKMFFLELTMTIRNILKDYIGTSYSSRYSGSLQGILDSMFDFEELKAYFSHYFVNIAEGMTNKSIYATDDIVEKVKLYVQKNYQQDLTLEFITSLFYINRSYCSYLFKKVTGNNFVDYVNSIRIEKAKELLLHSDKKMYQIAKAVGYDNAKYFFRIFKKIVGMTPEQFRNQRSLG